MFHFVSAGLTRPLKPKLALTACFRTLNEKLPKLTLLRVSLRVELSTKVFVTLILCRRFRESFVHFGD